MVRPSVLPAVVCVKLQHSISPLPSRWCLLLHVRTSHLQLHVEMNKEQGLCSSLSTSLSKGAHLHGVAEEVEVHAEGGVPKLKARSLLQGHPDLQRDTVVTFTASVIFILPLSCSRALHCSNIPRQAKAVVHLGLRHTVHAAAKHNKQYGAGGGAGRTFVSCSCCTARHVSSCLGISTASGTLSGGPGSRPNQSVMMGHTCSWRRVWRKADAHARLQECVEPARVADKTILMSHCSHWALR